MDLFDPKLDVSEAELNDVGEIVPVFLSSVRYRAEKLPGGVGAWAGQHLGESEVRTVLERAVEEDEVPLLVARYPNQFGEPTLVGALLASLITEGGRPPGFVEPPILSVDYLARTGAEGFDTVPVRKALVAKLEELAMRRGIGAVQVWASERPQRHRSPYYELGYETVERRLVKLLH